MTCLCAAVGRGGSKIQSVRATEGRIHDIGGMDSYGKDTSRSKSIIKLHVCDVQSARETVAPVFTKVNSAAKQQYSKALENERVCCSS